MNILLLVVIAFLIINALAGMKRGLIKTVFSMFSVIAALILTAFISPVVTQKLQENEELTGYFAQKVDGLLPFDEVESMLNLDAKKTEQAEFLQSLPLPESIREQLMEDNSADFYSALGVDNFRDYLSNYIACMIISAISFVLTFVVLMLLLKVLCISLDLISKLPVLNQVNHLLGLAGGAAYALLLIWIGGIVLTAVSGTAAGRSLLEMVNDSAFLSFLFNHNPLLGKVSDLSRVLF